MTIANVQVNPNEPQTKEDQFSLSLERELMANFGVRVTGLYSRRFDILRTENLRRGPEVYTIANTRPDPGPDARVGTADDPGTTLTWYEYPAAYRPRAIPVEHAGCGRQRHGDLQDDRARGDQKRFSNGWQLLASYSATHSDIPVAALSNINPNTPINARQSDVGVAGSGVGRLCVPGPGDGLGQLRAPEWRRAGADGVSLGRRDHSVDLGDCRAHRQPSPAEHQHR